MIGMDHLRNDYFLGVVSTAHYFLKKRFEVNGTYTPPGASPYPAKYSICFTEDLSCIKKQQTTSTILKDIGIYIPPFEETVAIQQELLESNSELLERSKTALEKENIKLVCF